MECLFASDLGLQDRLHRCLLAQIELAATIYFFHIKSQARCARLWCDVLFPSQISRPDQWHAYPL